MILGILAALVPYIPVVLQIVGWAFKTFGASEEQLKQYQEMIDRANKEGLLSVDSHDRLLKHKAEIEERLKSKK
jgi:flagellar motor component MotA